MDTELFSLQRFYESELIHVSKINSLVLHFLVVLRPWYFQCVCGISNEGVWSEMFHFFMQYFHLEDLMMLLTSLQNSLK